MLSSMFSRSSTTILRISNHVKHAAIANHVPSCLACPLRAAILIMIQLQRRTKMYSNHGCDILNKRDGIHLRFKDLSNI
jgi:hypothetical protein